MQVDTDAVEKSCGCVPCCASGEDVEHERLASCIGDDSSGAEPEHFSVVVGIDATYPSPSAPQLFVAIYYD